MATAVTARGKQNGTSSAGAGSILLPAAVAKIAILAVAGFNITIHPHCQEACGVSAAAKVATKTKTLRSNANPTALGALRNNLTGYNH